MGEITRGESLLIQDLNEFVRQTSDLLEDEPQTSGIRPNPVIEVTETTLDTTRFGFEFGPQPEAQVEPGGGGEPEPPTVDCDVIATHVSGTATVSIVGAEGECPGEGESCCDDSTVSLTASGFDEDSISPSIFSPLFDDMHFHQHGTPPCYPEGGEDFDYDLPTGITFTIVCSLDGEGFPDGPGWYFKVDILDWSGICATTRAVTDQIKYDSGDGKGTFLISSPLSFITLAGSADFIGTGTITFNITIT